MRNILTGSGNYDVIFLLGLRRVGKSYALNQLANDKEYKGLYLNFRDLLREGCPKNELSDYIADALSGNADWVLLDEVCYIPEYDIALRNIDIDAAEEKKKIVITGTAYESLKNLASAELGGRSQVVEMFPLSFEEYLYFGGKIREYGEEYEPSAEDVHNFHRMKNLPAGMNLIIDRTYMNDFFNEIYNSKKGGIYLGGFASSLTRKHYQCIADLLAYSLNYPNKVNRLIEPHETQTGAQEFGAKKIRELGGAAIFNQAVVQFAKDGVQGLTISDISKMLMFMLSAGFLFVDTRMSLEGADNPDTIISDLMQVKTQADLEAVLEQKVVSVISPLLYSRLMVDLEELTKTSGRPDGEEAAGTYGDLYELAVKAEDIYRQGYAYIHSSYKYDESNVLSQSVNEVDLIAYEADCNNGWAPARDGKLLFEATINRKAPAGGKGQTKHNLKKAYPNQLFTRVVTDMEFTEKRSCYHMIAYPKALLMLSNGSIFNLEKSTASGFTKRK